MPTVVNRHRYLPVCISTPSGDRFWGPPPKVWPLTGRERKPPMPVDAIYVGRGSPLGNPFHWDSFFEDALGLFRVHLAIILGVLSPELPDWPRLCHRYGIAGVDDERARSILARSKLHDSAVMRQLRSIGRNTAIVCSCHPKPCHANIIATAWAWLVEQGTIKLPDDEGERVEIDEPESTADMIERLTPAPVTDYRIHAAIHELTSRGVNAATWSDANLVRWYDERMATDQERDARTAAARHPMDEDA